MAEQHPTIPGCTVEERIYQGSDKRGEYYFATRTVWGPGKTFSISADVHGHNPGSIQVRRRIDPADIDIAVRVLRDQAKWLTEQEAK